jgi:hypothetical protein
MYANSPRTTSILMRLAAAAVAGACALAAAKGAEPSSAPQQTPVLPAPRAPLAAEPGARPKPAPPPTTSLPQTQPARLMLWDRTRIAADLARRENRARQALAEAKAKAEREPGDPLVRELLVRAEQRVAEVVAANAKAKADLAGGDGGPEIALEKAAYLGIASSPAAPVLRKQLRLADGMGLVVDYVEPDSPAAAAGLQPYDVATRLNEQILVNPQQLAVLVRTYDPGTEVTLTVVREGKQTPVKVKLVERDLKPLSEVNFGAAGAMRRDALAAWLTADGHAPPPVPARISRAPSLTEPIVPPAPLPPAEEGPLRPGDTLRVTIYNLVGPGIQTIQMSRVGRDGKVQLPYLNEPIRAEGRTDRQVADAIRKAYREAKVMQNPLVNVQRVMEAPKGLKREQMLDELPVKGRELKGEKR